MEGRLGSFGFILMFCWMIGLLFRFVSVVIKLIVNMSMRFIRLGRFLIFVR